MNKKGIVSDINNGSARVVFPDIDNIVSGWLTIPVYKVNCSGTCNCSGCYATLDISVNDKVLVCLYDNDFNSGVIVAKLR